MSETFSQVNYDTTRQVLFGDYHDRAIQGTIAIRSTDREERLSDFRSVVDQENLNARYSQAISSIEDYFASRDLSISPLRVVSVDVMQKAYEVSGEHLMENVESANGRYINDRAIVIEDDEILQLFGDDYVLGIGLHEAAHSLGRQRSIITTQETMTSLTDARPSSHLLQGRVEASGLVKADFRDGAERPHIGEFWEEAFADLTRVRALRQLNRSHNIKGESKIIEMDQVAVNVLPTEAPRKDLSQNMTNRKKRGGFLTI